MTDDLRIPEGEIHLWWASLDLDEPVVARLREFLDTRERERADRFRVPHAARRFVAARAALKIVLATVVETDPELVEFGYGGNGKPFLSGGGPQFNSSDSGDIVVVAAGAAELGVDVEIDRRLPNSDRLARRICTARELELLSDYSEDERDTALLRLWTFKEAALKAVGTGLPGGLRRVEFEFGPGVAPTVKRLREHTSGWTLMTPDLENGLLCSLVVEGPEPRLVSTRLELQSE